MKHDTMLKTKNGGFSLVELLVALAILVIAVTAFVPSLSFVAKASQRNNIKMTAGNIAASVVEEIRALPYDEIGTAGGNPSGVIPQASTITVGGIDYQVETRISWGSAKSSVTGKTNIIALKTIRVAVKAPGAFSGAVEKIEEINSIASRESEESFIKNGHLRVSVRNAGDMPYIDDSITVRLVNEAPTPAADYTMATDMNGQVLFGILNAGTYKVNIKLPVGTYAAPWMSVTDGWIVLGNVEVNDYQTTEVRAYLDKADKYCKLSVKLVSADAPDGDPIVDAGTLSLNWQNDSYNFNLIENKSFDAYDFVDDMISQDFIGPLWRSGTYTLSIRNVTGYNDFDMEMEFSGKPLMPDGTLWDGLMLPPGQALELRVPMREGTPGYFYSEDTKAEFDNATVLENLTAAEAEGGLLSLRESNTEVNLLELVAFGGTEASSAEGGYPVENISDGRDSTYWRAGNNTLPQWIQWNFGIDAKVTRVEIRASEYGGWGGNRWSNVPKNFNLQYSPDSIGWDNVLYNGTLSNRSNSYQIFNISEPQPTRYFRMYITSAYDGRVAVNEVRLRGTAGYVNEGTRISRAIALDRDEFASAPSFRINWEANTEADTYLKVYTAVTNSDVTPAESEFTEASNGGYISGITRGSDIRGKYLWVMEKLGTDNVAKTPSLDWLNIDY